MVIASQACVARSQAVSRPSNPPFQESITEPGEIAAVLRLLVELGASATIHADRHIVELATECFDEATSELSFRCVGAPPAPPFTIHAASLNALYRIPVERARIDTNDRVCVTAPARMERIRSRRTQRVVTQEPLRVVFDHPLASERRIERPVIDLTHDGLSFAADASCAALIEGTIIAPLLVERPSGEAFSLRGRVTSCRTDVTTGALAIGCTLVAQEGEDAQHWRTVCEELLFPNSRRGAAEVWSVYRDSGYFGLADTIDGFEHLRAGYIAACRSLASAPQLGCQARWPAYGPAAATVTNLRLYPSCFFSYHLAVRPEQAVATRAAEALRELYRQYIEHCLSQPDARFQMAYVQENAHWSMRMHVDVPRRYSDVGHALIHPFRALAVRAVAHEHRGPRDYTVAIADDAQLATVVAALRASKPAMYCDALEYVPDPELFGLRALQAQWAAHGMERERKLLVAKDGEHVIAAAVVESAQEGLHLFGLLDTLRMYALAGAGERAFPQLLHAARIYFRRRGRKSFCYLEEEGELPADGHDVKAMSRALMTIMTVDRLPEMLEHVYQATAPAAASTSLTRSTPTRSTSHAAPTSEASGS